MELKKFIATTIREYLNENNNYGNIIDDIKNKLISDDNFMMDSYEQFIDNQSIGECQTIVNFIKHDFPQVKKVFGEIEVDEPYIDENDEEQILMTHHWIELNGKKYDFSKGTLMKYINWIDKYDPSTEGEEWRYRYLN
jgi:hypothetical protein